MGRFFYLLSLFVIVSNYGAQGCHLAATALIPAGVLAALGIDEALDRLLNKVDSQVVDNMIERIDRALPELKLLENRDKWEDALKEYGTMWKDVLSNQNKRSLDLKLTLKGKKIRKQLLKMKFDEFGSRFILETIL